jgi:hypothetical protein
MNEPLMHATIALAARCAERTPPLTSREARVIAQELASAFGLWGRDCDVLFDAAESFTAPSEEVDESAAIAVAIEVGYVNHRGVDVNFASAAERLSDSPPSQSRSKPTNDQVRPRYQQRSKWRAMIAMAMIAALGSVILMVITQFISLDSNASPEIYYTIQPSVDSSASMAADIAVTVPRAFDAGDSDTFPPSSIDIQNGPTRGDIVAVSHFGFFSIAATAKTQIFIDNKNIGDAPLDRIPLSPGTHKVRAVGPRGMIKLFNITIYGGRVTDEGQINWKE